MFAETQRANPFKWNVEWGDLRDASVLGLIASNMVVVVWALVKKWNLAFLISVYWAQSVIIGIFWFFTIVTYKNAYKKYTEDPFELPDKLNAFSRLGIGLFFLLHFGGFHLGYIVFLLSRAPFAKKTFEFPIPVSAFVIFTGLFFVNQLILSIKFARKSEHKPANISKLMSFPYARVIPMHFTIILGGWVSEKGFNPQFTLLFFLALKTAADVIMHIQQKKGFADEPLNMSVGNVAPYLISVPKSDQVVLSDGKVVSLKGKDELAKKLKSIRALPLEVQAEVYEKLLTGEGEEQHEQKQAKVKCRCARANRFKGKGVVEYAKRHLKLTGTTSSGTKVHYICPETGKKWTREGYTLTAYQDKPKQ